jgi:hypothetical protein
MQMVKTANLPDGKTRPQKRKARGHGGGKPARRERFADVSETKPQEVSTALPRLSPLAIEAAKQFSGLRAARARTLLTPQRVAKIKRVMEAYYRTK